jgi:hypothetical protein
MPRLIPIRLFVVCALVALLVVSMTAIAAAKVPVGLRVVGGGGKVLADEAFKTGTTAAPTSPRATCFGKGTGGSGRAVKIKGATALGLLAQAAKSTSALRPLLLTDAFDFGLGICSVGGYSATSKLSWYLKVNHKNPERGGEVIKLKAGDEVLWALASYPYPKELSLVAPFSAHPGEPFPVSVFSYDDKGKRRPAAGVMVTGASGPTDSAGHATVTLSEGTTLVARRGKDIPSNGETVAMCDASGACPVP